MSGSRVPPHEIFKALDGHRLSVNGSDWDVCVFSVTDTDERRWVQLGLEGRRPQVLTIRLAPGHLPHQAVASLSGFLADPVARPENVLSHVA